MGYVRQRQPHAAGHHRGNPRPETAKSSLFRIVSSLPSSGQQPTGQPIKSLDSNHPFQMKIFDYANTQTPLTDAKFSILFIYYSVHEQIVCNVFIGRVT